MDANGWISVKDKLPEDFEKCLVQYELRKFGRDSYGKYRQEVTVCIYNSDLDFWYATTDASTITDVVAWQPIPKFLEDPDIPKKGDYGIFNGERWINVGSMFTPISEPQFNDKSHISEYQKDILRNIYNDLWDFAEEIDNDFTGVWTVDNVIVRLNDYISRIKEVSDNQGE